jgi:acyl-coenzyme A thioesterase PaaI-like protein
MVDDGIERPWRNAPPGRLLGRGHPVGEQLDAHEWRVLEHAPGRYRIEATLPARVRNPRGGMFGGFAPAYADLVAVQTARSVDSEARGWMATVNMRLDFFEPIVGERFVMDSHVVHTRGSTHLVEVRFEDAAGELFVFALLTLRRK